MAADKIDDWERTDNGILAWFIRLQEARRDGDARSEAYCGEHLARLGVYVRFIDEPLAVVTVKHMLAGLRNSDPEIRLGAGSMLTKALAAGLALQGVPPEDVEHGAIGRDLSALLGRAMSGDATAVDALEKVITDHPTPLPQRNATPKSEEVPSE